MTKILFNIMSRNTWRESSAGNSPIRGILSDVAGILSDIMSRNTHRESSTVISRDIFSPVSGGRQNTRSEMAVISAQGMIRLKK